MSGPLDTGPARGSPGDAGPRAPSRLGRPARRRGGLRAALAWAALASAGGCAAPGSDLHLSPLVSRLRIAGGGSEIEALAGAVRWRHPDPPSKIDTEVAPAAEAGSSAAWRPLEWALRPLVSERIEPSGDRLARFLVPLGTRTVRGPERVNQLLPIWRSHRFLDDHGHPEWRLLVFPVLIWSHDLHGRTLWAVFPFAGVVERFLSFDRLSFFLFPLFAKTERGDVTGWHVLWPIFCASWDVEGSRGWRFWPLVGVARSRDHLRRFFLWPIFQHQRNNLRAREPERETKWMVFPLFGHAERGEFDAWTWLWPFFGFARNPENGFWAWDGPWPLVRIQRPGTSGLARRTRFWPFWSRFEDPGLDSTWVLWPIFNQRHERYADGERRGEYVVPLWQNWRRTDREGRELEAWTKLWPLYQRHAESRGPEPTSRTALPALNPLWHTPVIDDHYAWLYELYTRETRGEGRAERVRERSWGGLWRREREADEERHHVTLLWSRRTYRADGGRVRETSLLMGLLRWRTRADGRRELLRPAFPGPGWPGASSER